MVLLAPIVWVKSLHLVELKAVRQCPDLQQLVYHPSIWEQVGFKILMKLAIRVPQSHLGFFFPPTPVCTVFGAQGYVIHRDHCCSVVWNGSTSATGMKSNCSL